MPSFEDTADYNGTRVHFYKRAQLLVSDIYQAFGNKGPGELTKMDQFTACADYKIPQVLRKLGILQYDISISEKIDSMVLLSHGCKEEVEIRAATIWAVELITRKLKRTVPSINAIHVNDHLWLLGQQKSPADKPYHRTLTTAY